MTKQKRFIVTLKQACVVEWSYPVMANNREHARRKFVVGDRGVPLITIGDVIGATPEDLEIEEG